MSSILGSSSAYLRSLYVLAGLDAGLSQQIVRLNDEVGSARVDLGPIRKPWLAWRGSARQLNRIAQLLHTRNYGTAGLHPAPDSSARSRHSDYGASDGIGRALAKAAARMELASSSTVATRSGSNLIRLILNEGSPRPSIAPLDFEKAGPVEFDDCVADRKEFGRLDGLVHNAGMLGERAPIVALRRLRQVDADDCTSNVNAPFVLTRTRAFAAAQVSDPTIVFTSSGVGPRPTARVSGAYLASKCASDGLMHMWRYELEDTTAMRVNSVIRQGADEHALQAYPLKIAARLPNPEKCRRSVSVSAD